MLKKDERGAFLCCCLLLLPAAAAVASYRVYHTYIIEIGTTSKTTKLQHSRVGGRSYLATGSSHSISTKAIMQFFRL